MAAEPRDIVYTLEAGDLEAEARPLVSTNLRCGGIVWGDDALALVGSFGWHDIVRRSMEGLGHQIAPVCGRTVWHGMAWIWRLRH